MKRLARYRFSLRSFALRIILPIVGALTLHCGAMAAYAQHGGSGHIGGRVHVSGPARGIAPRVMVPRPITPIAPVRPFSAFAPRTIARPVLGNRFGVVPSLPLPIQTSGALSLRELTSAGVIIHRPHPIHPFRPIVPIAHPFRFGFPVGFEAPFFGLGFGFNSGFWPNCDLSLGWAYGCYGLPSYGNGAEYKAPFPSYSPVVPEQIEPEIWPLYVYGGGGLRYVQLYLKDGTVYNVIDYWLVNGQLLFKTVEDNGTKVVEHTVDFDQLDLQKTVDVNTQRGFRFVLRDEPIEQYLQDHPAGEPNNAPPEPPQPSQAPSPEPVQPLAR